MRTLGVFALLVLALGAVAAFSWQSLRGEEPRTVVLLARGMAFVAEEGGPLNPLLALQPGEHVRVVLRNLDPGMKHDLRIEALGLKTRALSYGESDALVFAAPDRATAATYDCSFHARMMRGRIVVR